jgi:hypothetical protein
LRCGIEVGNRPLQFGLCGGRRIEIGLQKFAVRLLFVAALQIMPVIAVVIALMAIAPPTAATAAAPPPFALLVVTRLATILALVRLRSVLRLAGLRTVVGLDVSFGLGERLAFRLIGRVMRCL